MVIEPSKYTLFSVKMRALTSKRLFSVTPQRSNLIADLYVQQIKQFKPSPVSSDASEAIKKFQIPSKPAVPSEEVSADSVGSYETEAVETEAAPSAEAAPTEDWFVFEEQDEH